MIRKQVQKVKRATRRESQEDDRRSPSGKTTHAN